MVASAKAKARLRPRAKPKPSHRRGANPQATPTLFVRAAGEAAASTARNQTTPTSRPRLDFRLQIPTFTVFRRTASCTPISDTLNQTMSTTPSVEKVVVVRSWCVTAEILGDTYVMGLTSRHLLDFLDCLFLEGADLSTASAIVAAATQSIAGIFAHEQRYGHLGRALRGWPLVARTSPQLWMPEEVVYAIMGDFFTRNKTIMACNLLVQLKLYLRPGEAETLRPHRICTHPDRHLSHYGMMLSTEAGDSLMLRDGNREDLIAGVVLEFLHTRPQSPGSCAAIRLDTEFHRSLQTLQLDDYSWTRYSVRFAGAAADLQRHRPRPQVVERGRWLSYTSMPPLNGLRPRPVALPQSILDYGQMVKDKLTRFLNAPRKCPSYEHWALRY